MTRQELLAELKIQGIRANTISFYVAEEGSDDDDSEAFFGTCDLSGIRGDVVHCMALDRNDEIVRFEAGTWLVHGYLGKLAGAF